MWWMDPTATDNCDKNPKITSDYAKNDCFPLGVTQVWCYAEDKAGNVGKCSYKVNVKVKDDYTAPTMTCPKDIMAISAYNTCTKVNFTEPKAVDNCDANPTVTCDTKSGTCFPLGKNKITCTAKDKSGNTSTCSFYITVMTSGDFVSTINTGAEAADNKVVTTEKTAIESTVSTTTNLNTNTTLTIPARQKLHYEFKAYPNPVDDFVTLELQQYQGKQVVIQMFNTLGQQVYNAQLKEVSETHTVDTHNLSSGTYYIKIAVEGAEPTAKMIIKN